MRFVKTRLPTIGRIAMNDSTLGRFVDRRNRRTNLIRRPLVVSKGKGVFGYKPEQYEAIVSK